MYLAITREVSSRFNECEITHIERTPIDVSIARDEHHQYIKALKQLGCKVVELPEEPTLPDSVFVEDTAFVLPEAAVITRPGADSRKPETEVIAQYLSAYRPLLHITAPATVDGGDVLVLGKDIYVGISTRSNIESVRQIQSLLKKFGYKVTAVEMHDCLHLKTAITMVDKQTILINPNWVDAFHLKDFDWIEIDTDEPFAANCLPIGETIIFPSVFPKTQMKLEKKGYKVLTVNVSELAKAEGAVTCCSLVLSI